MLVLRGRLCLKFFHGHSERRCCSLASSNQATRSTSGIFVTALIVGRVHVRAGGGSAVLVVVCGVVSAVLACTARAGGSAVLVVVCGVVSAVLACTARAGGSAVLVVVCGVVSAVLACTARAGGSALLVVVCGVVSAVVACRIGRRFSRDMSKCSNRTPFLAARSVLFWRASSSRSSFPLSDPAAPPLPLPFRFFPFFFVTFTTFFFDPFPTFFFFFELRFSSVLVKSMLACTAASDSVE